MQTAVAPRNRIAELFWASPPRERANPLRGSGSRPKSRAGGSGVPQNPVASHTANLRGARGLPKPWNPSVTIRTQSDCPSLPP